MEETESQIAKILLGNNKASNTYVHVMAEKAASGLAELYVVAELPLFNPAAEEACENICLAISSTLKRAYKRNSNQNFENAISQINDELGKLAGMGQTQWIDKLNCILAVKEGTNFSIASCGKVSAFMLRNKEYTDISCSPEQSHPLKTFENFAVGKIRLGDLFILSTTQLFNHLSMDRLLDIVSHTGFLSATQTVIELLKANSDPQVSFGVLFNLQVTPGQATEEEIDLENYIVEKPTGSINLFSKSLNYVKSAFVLDHGRSRVPKVNLPKVNLPKASLGQSLKNLSGSTKNLVNKSKGWWKYVMAGATAVKSAARAQNYKNFSPIKKFLFISVAVLLIALTANIVIALRLKQTSKINAEINTKLKTAQTLLGNAQASLLYKDDLKAAEYLKQAKDNLPAADKIGSTNKELFQQVQTQIKETEDQMEKIVRVAPQNLGSLGAAERLISLPEYFAVSVNSTIISYNRQNNKVEDSNLKLGLVAQASVWSEKNRATIYDGKTLYSWDYVNGSVGAGYSQSVPDKDSFAGLAFYPTNNRVYLVDKKSAAILSYISRDGQISRPVVAARDPGLAEAIDISIDGSIYVLTKTGINKFQSGKLADFSLPPLPTPFSGEGKIYTQKDFKYIYVLDQGNNRILVLDKKGNLAFSLKSDDFTKLKDLFVDEKAKTIYILNDTSLLKATLP